MSTPNAPAPMASEPASAPRPATSPMTTTTADQATIGKSLVIKGEVTGSESLYIDGRVEGSISLAGNRVTIGRNGVVAATGRGAAAGSFAIIAGAFGVDMVGRSGSPGRPGV